MCSLPPYNSPGSTRSAVALPVAVIKSLPLTAGLGLSLAIVLLHTSHSLAQPISIPEVARSPSQQSAAAQTIAHAPASAQHLLFVSPIVGNDISADGSQRSPFRTITHALEVAQPNTLIMLTAGTYSVDSGEIFPLMLQPGVTIQGDPSTQGRGIVIRGGGAFLSPTSAGQNIAILGANQAQLLGVTVTNPNPRGYGMWVESGNPVIADSTFTGNTHDGISTVGNSMPLVRNNRFDGNGANGITVFGQSQPEIRGNVFEQTGFAINVAENAAPLIVDNQINQNKVGVLVQENARPVLRGNTIEDNQEDGVTAIAHAQPNLGTATDPGNNVFRNNLLDLNADATDQVIPAFGNQLANDRLEGEIDLAGTSGSGSGLAETGSSIATQTQATIHSVPPQASSSQVSSSQVSSSQSRFVQAAQSQIMAAPPQPLQAQVNRSQVVRSAASRTVPAITELPPATISTLPPSLPTPTTASASIAQVPANVSRMSTHAATPVSVSVVSQSAPSITTEVAVLPPTQSQAAIGPIAHQRSVQPAVASAQPARPVETARPAQPTIAISVPPPNNTFQPALAQRATPIATVPPTNSARSVTDLTVANAERTHVSNPAVSNPTISDPTIPNPAVATASRSAMPSATASRTLVDAAPSARAIEIPVPPPNPVSETTLAYAPRPAPTPLPSAFTAPIEIPVPLPESSAAAPAAVRNQDFSPPETRNAVSSANLLPVPGGDVPIGNVGDLPRISVASTQMSGLYYASSQIRSNLRYRVVVDASSESIQTVVRSIIPNAFPTSINGQQLMQVGAFSSRDNAEQTVKLLTQNGLLAVIQEID